jgi:hypothetical protein
VTVSPENEMPSVCGRIAEFLDDGMGNIGGLLLDDGQKIRFGTGHANLVTAIVTIGSQVRIEGDLHSDNPDQQYLFGTLITNLDSKRFASLPARVCSGKPGMLTGAPKVAASLAHPGSGATNGIALRGIERGYNGLLRLQAMLAYLKVMKRDVPGIGQILEEVQHTYQQALSRYDAQDFEGALEFASASECLSGAVEIVISRTLRYDTSYPSLVPPPPKYSDASGDLGSLEDELKDLETVIARIHWLLENGTLPLDDRTQVRKILSWGDAFYREVRRSCHSGTVEDAAELIQAASAAAHSAEHVCRKWYVTHAGRLDMEAAKPQT